MFNLVEWLKWSASYLYVDVRSRSEEENAMVHNWKKHSKQEDSSMVPRQIERSINRNGQNWEKSLVK
jgi:hypothetical protein